VKLTLPLAHLKRLLALVSDGAEADVGGAVPLYTHVRLSAQAEGLLAHTLSLDRAAKAMVPAALDEAGRCAVSLKRLMAAVRSLDTDEPVILQLGGARLHVIAAGTRMALPILPEADVDALLSPWLLRPQEDAALWLVDAAEFRTALRAARYAVSTDRGRPALQGVLLDVAPTLPRVVATDGARMAVLYLAGTADRPAQIVLPPATLDAVLTVLDAIEGPTEWLVHSTGLLFDTEALAVRAQGLSLPYPNYGAILEQYARTAHTVTVDRDDALVLARRAALFGDTETSLALTWGDGILAFAVDGPAGAFEGELGTDLSLAEAVTVPFNAAFVVDALAAAPEGDVRLSLRYDQRDYPIALDVSPSTAKNHRHLVVRRQR
jgi:DNA polymerase III sliding clamp (beta) subunit (PCNA family)